MQGLATQGQMMAQLSYIVDQLKACYPTPPVPAAATTAAAAAAAADATTAPAAADATAVD